MRIAFLIVDDNFSGGMNMVKAYASGLARQGDAVLFIAERLPRSRTLAGLPCIPLREAKDLSFDILVVTFWFLIFHLPVLRYEKAAHWLQHLPLTGRGGRLERAIYALPLPIIAVSSEIKRELQAAFQKSVEEIAVIFNGVDKRSFLNSPREAETRNDFRVLVEGPLEVAFKNVPAAIRVARAGGADELWLLTSSAPASLPGVDRIFSRVPREDTPAIYANCDVLVKMSLSEGMCLSPLEMFHAGGTAVMYHLPALDDYAVNETNCLTCEIGDEAGIVQRIARLKADPALLKRLRTEAGRTAANWPDLPDSVARFREVLQQLPPADHAGTRRMVKKIAAQDWPAFMKLKAKSLLRRWLAR